MRLAQVERRTAARMFIDQPERLAAAWRRERYSETTRRALTHNLLDSVVDDFIRQIGHGLEGMPGSPWSRTRGVLRLSLPRGAKGLFEEFGSLKCCLLDAMIVVGAPPWERQRVVDAINEAMDCALAHWRRLENPALPVPDGHFGGLVVEVFERPGQSHASARVGAAVAIH